MVASSVACIVALFVSILGLVRSLFDVTWPLGQPGVDQICLQVGQEESEPPSSMWLRTAPEVSSRSSRPVAGLGAAVMPEPSLTAPDPTVTLMPSVATPDPTITQVPPAPALVPSAGLTVSVPLTAHVVSTATTDHLFWAPILLQPEPDAQLQSEVHFEWQWDGQPLPEGFAFDLLIWSEAEHQEHQGACAYGVIETDQALERDVDLDYVQTIIEHGGGPYFWTVVVVKKEPYERVGVWGENRPFTYSVPESPAEATTESP
jgi:hypothetical protein